MKDTIQKEASKFTDSAIFEGMPSISAVIKAQRSGKSDRKINKILVDSSKIKQKSKELGFLKAVSAELGFEIEYVDVSVIESMTIGNSHGGIIAECSDRTYDALCNELIKPDGVYFMIEGIEDPYNFGNALRSIYAMGADGIIVGKRNWLNAAGVVARSSAGASELLPIFVSEPTDAVDLFKSRGYKIICAGIRDSVSIEESDLKKPILIILGGEKRGISRAILDKATQIVRINYGVDFAGSLSSVASCAVFAYETMKQNKC